MDETNEPGWGCKSFIGKHFFGMSLREDYSRGSELYTLNKVIVVADGTGAVQGISIHYDGPRKNDEKGVGAFVYDGKHFPRSQAKYPLRLQNDVIGHVQGLRSHLQNRKSAQELAPLLDEPQRTVESLDALIPLLGSILL